MSEIKLLPCPFCGGEATVNTVEPHKHAFATWMPDYTGGTFIECNNCSCAISGETEEEAIKTWNTRKPMQEIVEKIKEKLLQSINNANDESIENGHTLDFEHYFGEKEAYEDTLFLVKEVGGIDG